MRNAITRRTNINAAPILEGVRLDADCRTAATGRELNGSALLQGELSIGVGFEAERGGRNAVCWFCECV